MTVPETIAQLDVLERELDGIKLRIRTLRNDLFDSLDEIDAAVLG